MVRPRKIYPRGKKQYPWPGIEELELLRHYCREDFWTFFLYAFGAHLNPKGEKWIDPEIHEPMARWFQEHVLAWEQDRKKAAEFGTEPKQRHLAVLVHREIGKTTLITRAGQLWLHLRDPEIATAIGSEKTELSGKMLNAMLAVMDGSDSYAMWPLLYGNWSSQARKWTGKEIIHAGRKNTARQDPSFVIFGVETSITGSHPDAYFYDDPISYERLRSDANWLQAVNEQVSSLVPVIQGDGLIVWVGTRYDDNDHFGVAFDHPTDSPPTVASVTGMQTDSIDVDKDQGYIHVYFMAGRDSEGKPTTPKVWPESRLARWARKNPIKYAAQIMNDPTLAETNPITNDQLNQCMVKPEDVPWGMLRYAICFDTAFAHGSKRLGKDESVFVVHGYPRNGSGDVYICEVHGSQEWRAEDFFKRVVSTVQRYRAQGKKIFALAGDFFASGGRAGTMEPAFRNYFHDANEPMPALYEFNRNTKGQDKATRLVAAAAFWVDGHVRWVKGGGPQMPLLIKQMTQIGQMMVKKNMRDDYIDAHADAFQPELYQPMRRMPKQRAPWEKDANPIQVEGLDQRMFDDSDYHQWLRENPREPLRNP